MARYEIIDEPRTKLWGERLIVDPTIILFAAILVPFIWQPPLAGRFWIPLLWLVFNGYALGSSTLRKEIGIIAIGVAGWFLTMRLVTLLLNSGAFPITRQDANPYMVIVLFGIFFLTMYMIVFRQAQSYALYKYVRGDAQ